MPDVELELRSIDSLLDYTFHIPAYQRGYRWKEGQVRALLNDIDEFRQASRRRQRDDSPSLDQAGDFYCLQPVVVLPRGVGEDGNPVWELIDGQQRLTTIFLIIRYLHGRLPTRSPYRIAYQTRERSGVFLEHLDPEERHDNVDFHHIYEAHETIKAWFDGKHPSVLTHFATCLLDPDEEGPNVRVIWYRLPEKHDPIDAFVRLNVGKIRLTNAELIRALFLRSRNFQAGLAKASQLKLAQEWDRIEKRLQDDAFWHFLHSGPSPWTTRIDFLFVVHLQQLRLQPDPADDYGTFLAYQKHFLSAASSAAETDGHDFVEQLWRSIKQIAARFDEWHQDRVLYHLVGYWVTVSTSGRQPVTTATEAVMELLRERREATRTEFEGWLKSRIFSHLFPRAGALEELGESGLRSALAEQVGRIAYPDDPRRRPIRGLLLLLNVATLLRNPGSNLRFAFDLFHSQSWDIEHIRSVASEMPLGRADQMAWLRTVLTYWTGSDDEAPEKPPSDATELCGRARSLLDAPTFDQEAFAGLYAEILEHFGESEPSRIDNSIANLTLLDSGTNRSYQNAVFPIKRRRVLDLDKTGTFVPPCTTHVFLKYYSARIDQMMLWTESCGEQYEAAVIDTLTHFFMPGEVRG